MVACIGLHIEVPPHGQSKLYGWLRFQKTNRPKLSQDRQEKLDELGIEWTIEHRRIGNSRKKGNQTTNSAELAWMRRYQELKNSHDRTGHFRIPAQNQELRSWIFNQRAFRERLPAEKRALLDVIHFPWSPWKDNFMERVRQLEQFRKKYGHCRVPDRALAAEFPGLGAWVGRQRKFIRLNKIPMEDAAILTEMGFVWEPLVGRTTGAISPEIE